jgi:hypothetical protein
VIGVRRSHYEHGGGSPLRVRDLEGDLRVEARVRSRRGRISSRAEMSVAVMTHREMPFRADVYDWANKVIVKVPVDHQR